MRLFNKYVPSQIAKHVSRFFKGRIYVGKFEFDNAKLLIPSQPEDSTTETDDKKLAVLAA